MRCSMATPNALNIAYHVASKSGLALHYVVRDVEHSVAPAAQPWMQLGFHRCPHCPLHAEQSPLCPLAVRLQPLIEQTAALTSFEEVEVEVVTDERSICKQTTLQRALGSLMGLLFATSDCPHTLFLQPMACFHLPFANDQETLYRVASSYLLTQFFAQQQGQEPDWALSRLRQHYVDLHVVNVHFAERLRAASSKDAPVNGLILLDMLAKTVPYCLDDTLDEIAGVFQNSLRGESHR